MKKKDVIDLIKYHYENNEIAFKDLSYKIATYFSKEGFEELSFYILSLISKDRDMFVPQSLDINNINLEFLECLKFDNEELFFSEDILYDLKGIIESITKNLNLNKFLFKGLPGTGKTKAAAYIGKILSIKTYIVKYNNIIDSKLGSTSKNLQKLFEEIKTISNLGKVLIIFDEIDSLVLDRINSNDLREMGRVTSTFLSELDNVSSNSILIATTNLSDHLDKAILRRFDYVVDFNRYEKDDLIDIAFKFYEHYAKQLNLEEKNKNLFKKIIKLNDKNVYPSDMKNIIKTSMTFSVINKNDNFYRRFYINYLNKNIPSIEELKHEGFTVREIATLSNNSSKSTIARKLSEVL